MNLDIQAVEQYWREKEVREQRNISTRQMANEISVSPNTVSNWRNGHTNPSFEHIGKLSLWLGVDAMSIMCIPTPVTDA